MITTQNALETIKNNGGNMRAIKFRAWDRLSKKFNEIKDLITIDGSIQAVRFAHFSDGKDFQGIDYVDLQQFTGLTDRLGKEICEGDIFRYEGFKGNFVVQWETFGWRLKGCIPEEDRMIGSFPPIQMPSNNFEYIEIIGNIYENPELIKTMGILR